MSTDSNNIYFSYCAVASSVAVVYDWVLTWGQEFELVWRQRCSLISVIYLSVRISHVRIATFCSSTSSK
ncbi:hypothetical protein K503DRAFT_460060 [Rhizopogon vinicolor AM-OR11-026]|uniref:DUF6533 domain-containing protein n=1 Tax=Rhizopogon vinicolor AM-OR11-026 TaxID=1314800 RepID=A0A1B7MNR7_9AGAM|nr:hypothetical protein K503DRAFT_460060 [Rhizopogon vinicolor AM-OR11-026]